MSYDVGEDTDDAEVRHPGDGGLWGKQSGVTPGSAGTAWDRERRESRLPEGRHRAPPSTGSAASCHWKMGRKWAVGCQGRGVGAAPPHLQNKGDREHAAGAEADGEAQEQQDSPPQKLHHEHLEGRGRGKWGLRSREPSPATPRPGAALAGSSSPAHCAHPFCAPRGVPLNGQRAQHCAVLGSPCSFMLGPLHGQGLQEAPLAQGALGLRAGSSPSLKSHRPPPVRDRLSPEQSPEATPQGTEGSFLGQDPHSPGALHPGRPRALSSQGHSRLKWLSPC